MLQFSARASLMRDIVSGDREPFSKLEILPCEIFAASAKSFCVKPADTLACRRLTRVFCSSLESLVVFRRCPYFTIVISADQLVSDSGK